MRNMSDDYIGLDLCPVRLTKGPVLTSALPVGFYTTEGKHKRKKHVLVLGP